MKIYFSAFLIIFLAYGCGGGRKLMKKADKAFALGEYYKAYEMYERLSEKEGGSKQLQAELAFKSARCSDLLNDSKKAESRYVRAIRKKYDDPSVYLLCANQMLKNENYEEALEYFTIAKQKTPEDKRVDNGLKSLELCALWKDSVTRYKVENIKAVNGRGNDFAPAYAWDDFGTVFFTTTRGEDDKEQKLDDVSGMPLTNMYEVRIDRQGEWSKPTFIEDTTINVNFDKGASSFSADYKTMYFTVCKQEPAKKLGCQIVSSQRRGTEWAAPVNLRIVDDSISIGHPSLSADGLEMYFASRMPGGLGGADIWCSRRISPTSTWGRPINAGSAINTPGDELYPFIREDGNLYFSSDYPVGFGGLDIFRAIKDEFGTFHVSNMLPPINSPQDDFGIVFQGHRERGLFSSTRKEGKGGDDVYSFILPDLEFFVQGKIQDKNSDKGIAGAKVTVYGSDGSVQDAETKPDGSYRIPLQQYTDYIVVGAAEHYLRKKTKISTNNLIDNKTFEENISLISVGETVELPNIFYDFGKWTLNEQSKGALIELAELLEDNPNITIELGSHTDMVGDSLANMMLSKRRAQSVIDYLYEQGYDPDRLIAKGYGENVPVIVSEKLAASDTLFKAGMPLDAAYVLSLPQKEQQDKVNQINRRTELRVMTMDYMPKPEYFVRYRKRVKGESQ